MTTIKTRVTGSNSAPVNSAVVTVMSQTGEQCAIAHSDSDGQVAVAELDPGMYTVVATAPGYQPAARVAVGSGAGVTSLGEISLVRDGDAPTPSAGRWEIDSGHSEIEISVRHLGIASVRGRFTEFAGTIVVADEIGSSSVSADIKTAGIDTGNTMRDDILRSSAFFDTEQYPLARFRSTGITPATDETWTLDGELTMLTSTVPISLELTYLGEVDDPWGNHRAGFRATGTIRRKDVGINFDDTLVGGVAQIGNTATLTLDIQAVRV
ncbi:YceI family protein [Gordonia zhaorongruii]|uniref:YceI family protein n=1 Tax=Gordonia zhaorongruii TaxID=2597659 RepID=UPI001FD40E4C|nr:YceI family protein [Gordonia zhaorongruii]